MFFLNDLGMLEILHCIKKSWVKTWIQEQNSHTNNLIFKNMSMGNSLYFLKLKSDFSYFDVIMKKI